MTTTVRAKSRLRDTMYHICMILHFSHVFDTEKNLAEGLSLDPCNTECIHSKFSFQINFGAKKNSYFFSTLELLKFLKYHISVIVSRKPDTLYSKVSNRRNTSTSV